MKANPRIIIPLTTLAILLTAFTLLAAAGAAKVSVLAGQWQGKSRFTGISYEEATQKKIAPQDVEMRLHISADGKVTGTIGGAELSECVVQANRGWMGRLLHIKTDFVIRGHIAGAVVAGSEGGNHPISVPFNSDGTRMRGTVFVTYPLKYPYPFLNLQLIREP